MDRKSAKTFGILAFSFMLGSVQAQVRKDVDTAATKVGHKSAELASKGKSAVVDQKYRDMVGPEGQTIYIDHSSKYYYIDKKGKKVYVPKARLKAKKPE